MEKYFNKLKNINGFIGIETIIIAGVLVFAGIVMFNYIFSDTYNDIIIKIESNIFEYIN